MWRVVLLFFIIAGYSPAVLFAQGVVKGIVTEAGTDLPLPGVNVISDSGKGTATGKDGFFSLTAEAGSLTLVFRFVGYKAEKRVLFVTGGDTVSLLVSLSPDVTTLNEIVVSAGRSEQRLSELTVSMSVIKPYVIGRNHIVSADELIDRTPGIEILDGQASIRGGSGYSYGAGSRVLALVDGLPSLSADAGNIKWNTLPLENISRIEVIKGASSVLYGSSALNGVVNIITRDADEKPYTRIVAGAALFDKPSRDAWKWWNTPRTLFNASLSHSALYGRTGTGIGIKLVDDKGYRNLNDERYARVSLRLKRKSLKNELVSYGLNINTTLTAKTDFLLWEDAAQGALKQSPSTAMSFNGTNIAVDPFLSFGRHSGAEHKVNARYMTNINRMPGNENNNSDSHSIYSEYQFSSGREGVLAIVAGATTHYSIITSNFYGNHSGINFAGYSQFEASPLHWLRGVAGFRVEEFILDGEAGRPVPIFRAGLNATLAEATFLRASTGQGYRNPAIAEKHAYTTVGSIKILPNPEIRPESGWSSEAGIKHGFSVFNFSGQADLALFYTQNRDMIEFVFGYWFDEVAEEFTYGFKPTNIENSRVYGVETEVMLNYSNKRLSSTLTAGYTFMYPVEFNGVTGQNSGKYLKFRRKHSADINMTTALGRFETGINISLKSKILDIDNVFVNPATRETILPGFYDYWLEHNDGHCVTDLFLGYRFGTGYQFSLGIKNLTNTEYMGRPGDIMPHRQFSVQISSLF